MRVGGVFLQTAILQAVRLITGIFRTKLIALYLGPAGIGVFAQAQSLQSLILSVGSLSLATGYIQRVRYLKGRHSEEYREQVHGTVFFTVLAAVLSLLAILTPFLSWIEGQTFSGSVAPGFTGFVLWSVPLLALAQIYFEPRLIASERYGDYVKAICATSIISPFVLWFLLTHAGGWALAIQLVAFSGINCLLLAFFLFKHSGKIALVPKGWKWSHLRPILKVSLALVVSGIAFYGTAVWLRAIVLKNLGADYAGLIQVPIVISGYYAPLLTHVIWNVYHVRLSEAAMVDRAAKILAASFTFVILLQPLLTLWIMTFPGLTVGLVYTREFRHSINTFPIQFVGDFFYFLLTVLSVQILAQNRVRLYTALWLVFSGIEMASGAYFILIQKLALRSLASAYFTASALTLLIFFWPAMKNVLQKAGSEFRFVKYAFLVGLSFLVLQALLLRADADLPFRLLTAVVYSALLAALAWRKRTDDWSKRWRELITGET